MKHLTRRQLLGSTAAIAVSCPSVLLTGRALAAGVPRVDPNDPQAKALAYVRQTPRAANVWANCRLYDGAADADWGDCRIFPGKQVAAAGWSSAWVE